MRVRDLLTEMTTPLAGQAHNKSGGAGFQTIDSRRLIDQQGNKGKQVPAGTKIYITKPGTLINGADIGAPGGSYVLVGLNSSQPRSAVGYMSLSNIGNPENTQKRVTMGDSAQDTVAYALSQALGTRFTVLSRATPSSQVADMTAKIGNKKCQFEIKSRANQTATITFYDKSIRRGGNVDELNTIAAVFSGGKFKTFEQTIDGYRRSNPEVGFPGDEGTPPSGKLPPEFRVRDNPQVLGAMRSMLINHFVASGDNYFAVVNRDSGDVEIFWTTHGPNPLEAPEFPALTAAVLDTYGGAYKGSMRVALKAQLDPAARGLQPQGNS